MDIRIFALFLLFKLACGQNPIPVYAGSQPDSDGNIVYYTSSSSAEDQQQVVQQVEEQPAAGPQVSHKSAPIQPAQYYYIPTNKLGKPKATISPASQSRVQPQYYSYEQIPAEPAPAYEYKHHPLPVPQAQSQYAIKAIHHNVEEPQPLDAYPQYNFAYAVSDALTGDSKKHHEVRDGEFVKGQYSLVEPDGVVRTVTYTSDSINGFSAQVVRSRPSIHKAVIKATPIVPIIKHHSPKFAHLVSYPKPAAIGKRYHSYPVVYQDHDRGSYHHTIIH